MSKKNLIFIMAVIMLSAPNVYSDRGSIPFKADVEILEPTQSAVIAWDGQEQILFLKTELKASEATKVLEVIPLPAEPEVRLADPEIFEKVTNFMNTKFRRTGVQSRGEYKAMSIDDVLPAGEITFQEKIGLHDISVAKLLSAPGFVSWVEEYLQDRYQEIPVIPEPFKKVIEEYIQEGFIWFVFDVVDLGPDLKVTDIIQYRFMSDFVFFPLKITRTEKGLTTIDLIVLTPGLLTRFDGIDVNDVKIVGYPIEATAQDLKIINEEIWDLLGKFEKVIIRQWRIIGELSEFMHDLVVR